MLEMFTKLKLINLIVLAARAIYYKGSKVISDLLTNLKN